MKKAFWEYFLIIAGAFLLGVGINLFLVPFKLSSGGVGGVGVVLFYLFKIPLWATNLTLNAVLFGLGFKFANSYGSKANDEFKVVDGKVITLTNKGYIKRLPVDTYKTQNRGGVGVKGMTTNEEDFVEHIINSHTHDYILFFTSSGKVYRTDVDNLNSAEVLFQFNNISDWKVKNGDVLGLASDDVFTWLIIEEN